MAESLVQHDPLPDPIGVRRRCDAVCDEFEEAWLRQQRPDLSDFAARVPVAERPNLIRELISLDRAYRREKGESPQPSDYALLTDGLDAVLLEAFSTHLRQNASTGKFERPSTALPARRDTPAQPREQIGDYQIIAEIARGGMGVVYKARHRTLDRTAAVKLIRGGEQAGSEELRRFQIEATAAAALDHPAIVPVYELGQHDGQPFLAMAFVDGTSLWTRVKEAPLDPRLAANIMQRVAEGVQYAHEQGIIHRDLKPQNILLAAGDQPRITDFGLAKHHAADSSLTATGQILGTPSYMPPEQASGRDAQVGPLADVYSLGATLYCLLVGHPPFHSAHPVETLRQVIEQEPIPPRALNRLLPRDLETICLKGLQKNPAKRYATAGELAADLQRYLRGEPIQARAVSSLERAGRWCARNPVIASLATTAAGLLLTVAVVSTWAYLQQKTLVTQKSTLIGEKDRLITEKTALLDDKTKLLGEKEKLIVEKDQFAQGERKQRLNAENELYNSQIARSFAEIERGNLISANLALMTIPFPLRNWEHGYLTRRALGTPFFLEGQAGQYVSAKFSPNGRWIAAGGQDRAVRIWDAHTGKPMKILEGHPHMIMRVAFSAGSQRLASLGADGTLLVWDVESDQPLQRITIPNPPQWSLEFDRSGQSIAAGGQDGVVRIWNAETGKERVNFKAGAGLAAGLSFHPDGSRLAVAVFKRGIGELKIFDAADGKQLVEMDGNRTYCQIIRHSPDGRLLATFTDLGIQLWNAQTGEKVRRWDPPGDGVQDMAFSPDGSQLVTGAGDKSVRLHDVREGKVVATYLGHQYRVHSVDFSPDGSRVVSVSMENRSSEIKVWNVTEPLGDPLLRGHTDRANFIAFNKPGNLLASGSNDRTIKIWDIRTRQLLHTLTGHGFSIMHLTFDHSGKQLASVSFDAQRKAELKVWDVEAGKEKYTIRGHNDWIVVAAFSNDDKYLATASKDGTAKIWDVATQKEVATLAGHNGEVHAVSFHPNGEVLTTLSPGQPNNPNVPGQRILWKVPSWEKLQEFERDSTMEAPGEYSPDGKWLMGRAATGEIILRAADDETVRWVLRGHNEQLSDSAVNHDGSRLFSASYDHTLKVWDLNAGKEVLTIPLGKIIPAQLSIHPNDQLIAQGLTDHTIRLLDAQLDRDECWLRGHTSPIALMGVTKDGKLITEEVSKQTYVWDIATGRRLEEKVPTVELERVRVIGGLELSSGETSIDICPTDPTIARLVRNRKPAEGNDLWALDHVRRQATARSRHKQAAEAAEKADDPYAAAFHWNWLKGLDPADSGAAEKHAAAIAKLAERKLPQPPGAQLAP